MKTEPFDSLILGSGQAGKPLAGALARAGWKTALIERDQVGGTCINYGCTPTKTMVASARVAHLVRRSADFGVNVSSFNVDLAKIRERKRNIVESFRGGSQRGLERTEGLTLLFGEASFLSPTSVRVAMRDGTERELTAKKIFINTGARPHAPNIEGVDTVDALDSTSIMELDRVPEHLIVVGGGVIGLEFGQMFRRFGSRVTLIQHRNRLLPREDPEISDSIAEIFREDGMDVLLETKPQSAERRDGEVRLSLESAGDISEVTGSHLLLAAGRVPNTERLGLDAAGVETNSRGFIPVNERLETNVEGIYGLGDVNGGPAFTHVAYDDYRIVRANLLEDADATTNGRLIPYTVFIDPQLGRVGMTEKEARATGRRIRVGKMPATHIARALEADEARGLIKAVVDADTEQILGASVLCIEGGEVMSVLQMAMVGKVPYPVVRDGIFAHPTLAEALNNLFGGLKDVDAE